MTRHALVVLLALLVAATAASAQVLVFDMGSKDSALWPGAERVTAQDARWASTEGLTEFDSPATGSPVWTNAVTQDGVMGKGSNAFRFPAAAGPWNVYVLSGIGGKWDRSTYPYWDFDVATGGDAWPVQIEAPRWNGPYRFQHHTFRTTSTGQVEVKLAPRNGWVLSGIVAWQAKDAAAARQLIRDLEEWAPAEAQAKWHEDVRPPAGPAPVLRAMDQKRGFYVWHRHWATPIYPWTNPTPDEIDPALRAFASPGEYEPLTFTVRPLRSLAKATLTVSGLGPIPASAVEVRKVRFLKARRNYTDTSLYRIVPDVLERWAGGPLAANENATFWLTVHVPKAAPAGTYRGKLRFAADGQATEIPVVLRVLAVSLQDDPGHTYGIYYTDPLRQANRAPDEYSRQHWIHKSELEHADMAAHGTRNVTLDCWSGAADAKGEFAGLQASYQRLEEELAMAGKYGFVGPYLLSISTESIYEKYMGEGLKSHLQGVKMPPDAFFPELGSLVTTIEAERKRRGWPNFVYQPFDEPSSDPAVAAFMTRVFETVKSAGVRTYTTAAPEKPGYQTFKPYVDVWCTQTFLPDRDTVLADGKARGTEYWCYPNDISGENDHTPVPGARMTYGFGFWRSGFVRLIPWMYQCTLGDPFNYLDDGSMDFFVREDTDGAPIPVAMWEAYREGYDDMRYLYTLTQLIAKARQSSSAAAKRDAEAAQQVLDDTWNAIPVIPQYQYNGFWSPDEMDVRRWLIADRAERLSKLL